MKNNKNTEGIKLDDIITIDYSAKLKDGRTVLSTVNEGPLTFKVGHFPLVKGFNSAVLGMKIGELKKIIISPSDAFGKIDKELICQVPLVELPEYIRVGQRISGKEQKTNFNVLEVNSEEGLAILDGNHILAGQDLEFSIKILSIKYPPTSARIEKKAKNNFREIANDFLNIPLTI